jgi:hypothetical protein
MPGNPHVLAGEEIDEIGRKALAWSGRQRRTRRITPFEIFEDVRRILDDRAIGRLENGDAL